MKSLIEPLPPADPLSIVSAWLSHAKEVCDGLRAEMSRTSPHSEPERHAYLVAEAELARVLYSELRAIKRKAQEETLDAAEVLRVATELRKNAEYGASMQGEWYGEPNRAEWSAAALIAADRLVYIAGLISEAARKSEG